MNQSVSSLLLSFGALALALPVGWLVGVLSRQIRIANAKRRWSKQQTIIAEYTAPNDLRPSEIAYLYDRAFGEAELLATIFDLELRHKLALKPLTHSKLGAIDFHMRVTTDIVKDREVTSFEEEILLSIQHDPTWRVLRSDAKLWTSGIQLQLEADLRAKGFLHRPSSVGGTWLRYFFVGGLISIPLIILPPFLNGDWGTTEASLGPNNPYISVHRDTALLTLAILWGIGSILYGLASYLAAASCKRAMNMEKGTFLLRRAWPHIEGFRQYIEVVEQDKIKFENTALREAARQHALPYAVALNLSTDWHKRFRA
ncbi:MAG TPA: hypothetical protein VK694_03505 [Verrucomicrobiae bacterium]|nr:hypothetical protein [Verrucomicrobiae bacterium]